MTVSEKKLIPTEGLDIGQLEAELKRERARLSNRTLIIGLLCAAAAIVIVVTALVNIFPIYRVHGSSMEPTIAAGDTVICIRGGEYETGDIVAISFEGRILIKRLVAEGGDWVEIDEAGKLIVNGEEAAEPYAVNTGAEEGRVVSPVLVPDGEWYVMGDNRAVSGDSRLSEIGTVDEEQIIGRVIFRLFPFDSMGKLG